MVYLPVGEGRGSYTCVWLFVVFSLNSGGWCMIAPSGVLTGRVVSSLTLFLDTPCLEGLVREGTQRKEKIKKNWYTSLRPPSPGQKERKTAVWWNFCTFVFQMFVFYWVLFSWLQVLLPSAHRVVLGHCGGVSIVFSPSCTLGFCSFACDTTPGELLTGQ